MAQYLVTGAAGFIGSCVSRMMIEQGHTVIGVDNLNDAYDIRMKEHRLEKLRELPGFTFSRLDISRQDDILQLEGQQFDAIVNLAARAGVRASVENPWIFYETNVMGTLNLLELCRRNGVKKFLLASTSSIYGADPPYPTPEDAPTDKPLQAYAASKKAAEVLCYSYHHLYPIDVSVVRYFTVYGPAGRPDLAFFRFVQWITEGHPVRVFGDGEQSRGFTYVDDIARGTIQALMPVGYEIFNLGGHEVITINRLINLLEETIGVQAEVQYGPLNPADMFTNWADVSKAGRVLGWEPQVNLQEGARRLVDWYKAERSWASEVQTL